MVDPRVGDHDELAATARAVAVSLNTLTGQVELLTARQRNSWRAILGAYLLWLIEVSIVIALILFVFGLKSTNERLETSIHEQCSLYSLLIPSYREEVRRVSPLGPQGYDAAFRRLQASADRLSCGIPHSVPEGR